MTLHCPECGYDLTGLMVNRCPECGRAFDPATLRAEQAIRQPRWWVALLAVLTCAYAPFATWIPFQEHVEWFMMWPVLPGFFFGFLLHPRGPLEFAVMGVVALLLIAGAMYFARRRWRALIIACTLLALWTSLNAWGAYAVSRLCEDYKMSRKDSRAGPFDDLVPHPRFGREPRLTGARVDERTLRDSFWRLQRETFFQRPLW